MKVKTLIVMGIALLGMTSCNNQKEEIASEFNYVADRFYDLQVLRYQVPEFEKIDLNTKQFLYCLQEAALWGREIVYDQNYRYNIQVRRSLEAIIENYKGDINDPEYQNLVKYAKRIWFSNGMHHHYANKKFSPDFSKEWYHEQIKSIDKEKLPLAEGEPVEEMLRTFDNVIFNPEYDSENIVLDSKRDIIAESATNLYSTNLTQKEVEDFYAKMKVKDDPRPISYGLNSQLVKQKDKIHERIYKVDGLYGKAIEKIIFWLDKSIQYTNNDDQKEVIRLLIQFYETGDLKKFDEYSIKWTKNSDVNVDFTNGFIEVYSDPMGYRGAYQSVVYIKDFVLTEKLAKITEMAEWFEKNSPIDDKFKRDQVSGMSYKVINAVVESGDCAPTSPLGVNLPNANWIRAEYGSKSVSLGNIETAYDESSKSSGMLQEFFLPEQQEYIKKYGGYSGKLMTALHEVIGHGSGKLAPGVDTPKETLKNYNSPLEESRADLVALYYISDSKLVEEGLTPSVEVGKAAYNNYIVNGMMRQLVRLNLGDQIVQAHMRGRSMIANWCYENGKAENVIEKVVKEGKTYIVINDYNKLRTLIGKLLNEVQRIKSEGDFAAVKNLMETYGAPVNYDLHKEVLERYEKLDLAPYSGFIQPHMTAKMENNKIVDVTIEYPEDFAKQMMFYAKNYSVLPVRN
ncbi:MAG: dihydrofolate reductase [Salinivirgaceae bacterium]|nr:dihydrofolate reductase [Salinivirgaceae bacterium]MDD4746503.1 dihydrofolate reductase [Salinivirgaceae bacterium]MDY0281379.1 dihydrofolate reductase [Salinivirgaceae bacterium]